MQLVSRKFYNVVTPSVLYDCQVPSAKTLNELSVTTLSSLHRAALAGNTQQLPAEVDFVACFLEDGKMTKMLIQLK